MEVYMIQKKCPKVTIPMISEFFYIITGVCLINHYCN
jgi:hypothetical protein